MGRVRVKMFKPMAIVVVAVVGAIATAGAVLVVDQSMGPPDSILRVSDDGHYWALGETERGQVRFLVDTGASRVSLTRRDAERVGVILTDDAFTELVSTPGGMTRAAVVTLPWLAVGPTRLENVEAVVFHDGLGHSLLGMSFLGRLDGYGVTRGAMRMRS